MINDSPAKYGSISRFFHWSIAFLILWQLLKLGDRIEEGEHWIGLTLVPWHVSIGSLLLLFIVLRMAWALSQLKRRPLHDSRSALLVKGGHFLLYAGMLLLPITGALYLIGKGYGLKAFGVQLLAKGPEIAWAASIGSLHSPLAWGMTLLIVGHLGAVLYHRLIKRDDILQRML